MEEYVLEVPVCRVCLKSSDECIEIEATMLNENNHYEEPKTYFECLKACTHLEFEIDDGQPKHICSECSTELCAAYDFITKARISHDILTLDSYELVKCENPMSDDQEEPNESIANDELIENDSEIVYLPIKDDMEGHVEVVIPEADDLLNTEEDLEKSSDASEHEIQVLEEYSIDDYNDHEEVISYEEVPYGKCRCNMCFQYFPNLNLLKEHGEQVHAEALYCCEICCHRFAYRYALNEHVRRTHDTSLVKCKICQALVQSNLLRSHKRTHDQSKTFLCSACPRTFKTSTGLAVHSETHKENRQRQFECEQCNKKFLTERTFKVHTRTHWDRTRFKCELCDKEFMQKVNLKLHMHMHNGETMDCVYCQKKFVRKNDLTVHMRFHTGNFPYECSMCDKRFAIVSHLNYHKKRHQGMVYKCEVCDKEFINKSGLRNHSFQHTEMPFNCLLCDKGFPTRFKIKRHLKSVHHIEEDDDFNRLISKVNSKVNKDETIEQAVLEQIAGAQSDADDSQLVAC